ncbi:hypothetical protein FKP32DRAFT_1126812 [Trametes sanguinea]|nr:hypothetical protein FKP32DRAFT_1126812 [Trametes sanguinea]
MWSQQRFAILFSIGFSLASLVPNASALRRNVTIDDTYGDPTNNEQMTYSPWEAWRVGPKCSVCTAKPDAAQAYNGTWHDGSANDPSTPLDAATLMVNVPFIGASYTTTRSPVPVQALMSWGLTGEAVYVYCILAGSKSSPDGYSSLYFYLDGDHVGEFFHTPNGDDTYQYNVPVYVNHSVPFGGHLLQIVNGAIGGQQSLILLDYVVYTIDTEATVAPGVSVSAHTLPPATVASASSTSQLSSSTPPLSSALPTVVSQDSSGLSHSGLSFANMVLVSTIGSALLVAFIIGSALAYWRKRKRSRVAPSTEYLRSVAVSQGTETGPVAGASPVSPTSRWASMGDAPPTPVSVAALEPLRPGSARSEAQDTSSQGRTSTALIVLLAVSLLTRSYSFR